MKAHDMKTLKYTQLEIDMTDAGFNVYLLPFEVASNGHMTKQNRSRIEKTVKHFGIKLTTEVFRNMSKIALLCTMSVFHAHQTADWVDPPLLDSLSHHTPDCSAGRRITPYRHREL